MNDAKYIGLGVHQATISAAVLDSAGNLVMEAILETKAETILQFIHGLCGSLHVTFEEGTCAAWLHDLLKPHVAQVLVCDPRKNALMKVGNKNDRIDARKPEQAQPGLSRRNRNSRAQGSGPQLPGIDARYHTGDEPIKSPL
jgi:transposase